MTGNDFDLAAYRRLLETAQGADYSFHTFDEIGREAAPYSCLLRHDIDSELLGCGPMLDVEKSLGIRATYFVMPRSTAYNLFCMEAVDMIHRIAADGHALGLHFMGERMESLEEEKIRNEVLREVHWLEQEFDVPIQAVSFHQPTRRMLDLQMRFEGLVNTYNKQQLADYFYVSDTNMTWRQEHPTEIFSARLHARLQLLIHPMWWTAQPMATVDKWWTVLGLNQRAVVDHWQSRERSLDGVSLLPTEKVRS